jgi:hypothetical protein
VAAEQAHQLGEGKAKVLLVVGRNRLGVRTTRSDGGFGFSLLLCGQPGCLPLGCHYVGVGELAARCATPEPVLR